jgi:hypothetical protein
VVPLKDDRGGRRKTDKNGAKKASDDFAPKGLSATILGLRPLFCAPQGLQNSAQDSTPWESSTKSDAS